METTIVEVQTSLNSTVLVSSMELGRRGCVLAVEETFDGRLVRFFEPVV